MSTRLPLLCLLLLCLLLLCAACSADQGAPPAPGASPVTEDMNAGPTPGVVSPAQTAQQPSSQGQPPAMNTSSQVGDPTTPAAPAAPGPATSGPVAQGPTTPDGTAVVVEEDNILIVDPGEPIVQDDSDCDNILEVTYRDFTEDHPDFEMTFAGDDVRLNLIESDLDPDGKPVFLSADGCPIDRDSPRECANWDPMNPVLSTEENFDQWYHTVDGVNIELQKELELTETPPGSGVYVFDTDEFFPLGTDEGFGLTPRQNNHRGENFFFTTEIHLMFTYVAGQTFTFRGDDDMWIFVNDKLALDLGSMHIAWEGTIDFDEQATDLGITPGALYRMDIFHAERHTWDSNFRIETNIGCFKPAPPRVR